MPYQQQLLRLKTYQNNFIARTQVSNNNYADNSVNLEFADKIGTGTERSKNSLASGEGASKAKNSTNMSSLFGLSEG
jgi:hypothetical protein